MSRPFSETTPPRGLTDSALVVTVRVPASGGRLPVLPSGIGANFIRTLQDIPGASDSPSAHLFGAVPSVEKLPPLIAMLTIKIGSLFDFFALTFTDRSVVEPAECLPNETLLGTIASVSGTGVAVECRGGRTHCRGRSNRCCRGRTDCRCRDRPRNQVKFGDKGVGTRTPERQMALLTVWKAPGVVGKSPEKAVPVTYASPAEPTAML